MTLPKNVDDAYPLSPMQRLMLLHAISTAGNGVLLNQVCYEIRGPLDASAFQRAWDALVARHPALRTAFLWEGLQQPLQVVRSTVTLPFKQLDLSDAEPAAQAEAIDLLRREDIALPMMLGKAPLMRCTLVRLSPERHYFIWAIHHLVVDRWSHAVLFAELRSLYDAHARSESAILGPPPGFKAYVEWIARQRHDEAERFWRDELAGFREPTLLASAPSVVPQPRRLTTRRSLPADVTAAVRDRAGLWRTTPAAMVLASLGLVIAKRSGRDDIVYGVTVSGRPPALPEADAIVGSFVNNLPVRLTLRRDQPVADWVREIQRAQARRQAFAHVALADIHAWSAVPAARPLFDTLVLLNLTDESNVPWPTIELVADRATLDAAYPLLLSVTTADDRLAFTLVHDATLAEPATLLGELEAALVRLTTADPTVQVAEVAALPANVRQVRPATRMHTNGRAPDEVGIADALLHAWRDVLGVDDVGVDDDFFALGGTSLQAAQLFVRVERITGKALPLSTLFAAGSVRALLAAIDRPLARAGSIVRLRSAGTKPPIYAIPGIGGNVVGLSALARALGPDQPLFAFESPGLDGQEAPLASIEAIAERYALELSHDGHRQFHLLGLCWGAAVVAEMARKLAAIGNSPLSLALIDPTSILRETERRRTGDATGFLRSRLELYWDEFRDGDWGDRTRMLATKARRIAKLVASGDERKLSQGELNLFRVSEANKDAVIRYNPAPLSTPARIFITRYRGEGDDPRLEWLSLLSPRPELVPVGGVNAGDAIAPNNAGELATHLLEWLRASAERPGLQLVKDVG